MVLSSTCIYKLSQKLIRIFSLYLEDSSPSQEYLLNVINGLPRDTFVKIKFVKRVITNLTTIMVRERQNIVPRSR